MTTSLARSAEDIAALQPEESLSQQLAALDALAERVVVAKVQRIAAVGQLARAEEDDKKAATELAEVTKLAQENAFYRFARFTQANSELYARIKNVNELFSYAASIPSADLRQVNLDSVFAAADAWPQQEIETRKALEEARKESEFLLVQEGADAADLHAIVSLVDATAKLHQTNAGAWKRERARRRDFEKNLKAFHDDQVKVVQWCRQQMANVHNLKDGQQVEEFCASFFNNISVMESNFLVMGDMAEAVSPLPEVDKALIEVSDLWINLAIFAFEKLRSSLMEQHTASNLEAVCRQWAEYARRLKPFLVDAQKLLMTPTDEESVAVAAPLREACTQLQTDVDAHLLIVEHLGDFTLRQECLKDHYNAIRKTVYSKLTRTTQGFSGQYTGPRKHEYSDRFSELNDWIDCKAQSQSWLDLLTRVEKMRQLIADTETIQSVSDDRR